MDHVLPVTFCCRKYVPLFSITSRYLAIRCQNRSADQKPFWPFDKGKGTNYGINAEEKRNVVKRERKAGRGIVVYHQTFSFVAFVWLTYSSITSNKQAPDRRFNFQTYEVWLANRLSPNNCKIKVQATLGEYLHHHLGNRAGQLQDFKMGKCCPTTISLSVC